jgi:hypothetical protein
VFATRRLVPGDVIMIEEPVLVTKFGTIETTDQFNRMYADLHRQFKELAPGTQVTVLITVVWMQDLLPGRIRNNCTGSESGYDLIGNKSV